MDLVQFMDLAQRTGEKGVLDWLGFYWKSPLFSRGEKAVHALHVQEQKLHKKLLEMSEFFQSEKSDNSVEVAFRKTSDEMVATSLH